MVFLGLPAKKYVSKTAQMASSSLLQGGTGAGSILGGIGNGVSNAYNGIVGSGGLNGLYTSMTGANPIIADTGQAAQTASNLYGSAYDPLAGWSM